MFFIIFCIIKRHAISNCSISIDSDFWICIIDNIFWFYSNWYRSELLELVEATVPIVKHFIEFNEVGGELSDGPFVELLLVDSDWVLGVGKALELAGKALFGEYFLLVGKFGAYQF